MERYQHVRELMKANLGDCKEIGVLKVYLPYWVDSFLEFVVYSGIKYDKSLLNLFNGETEDKRINHVDTKYRIVMRETKKNKNGDMKYKRRERIDYSYFLQAYNDKKHFISCSVPKKVIEDIEREYGAMKI